VRFPVLRATMERRVLVNYRVDAQVLAGALPAPFRPRTVDGWGIAGICLIRLSRLRPGGLPRLPGLASENAAHRMAVEWDGPDGVLHGVYVPRRDTSSRLGALVGGRHYPGVHHRARFRVDETPERLELEMHSADGDVYVRLRARPARALAPGSVFRTLAAASAFFEEGGSGYSPRRGGGFDSLALRTVQWAVEPLEVEAAESTVFDDPARFPPGAAVLDHALVMRSIEHAWVPEAPLPAMPRLATATG
jgi:hypothetical protein